MGLEDDVLPMSHFKGEMRYLLCQKSQLMAAVYVRRVHFYFFGPLTG
jgi:hypothetical protein